MALQYLNYTLLIVSVLFLFAQLLVNKKRAVNFAFALFSGSMAMVAAQKIGAGFVYPYHYLIGLGTCATCNAFWLVSRGLFRDKNPIEKRHIIVAVVIAVLIIVSQMLKMTSALSANTSVIQALLANGVTTLTEFLSTTIIALTLWEALRGYSATRGSARHQRTLFILSIGSAIFLCMFVAQVFLNQAQFDTLFPWFTSISALLVLTATQGILIWQQTESAKKVHLDDNEATAMPVPDNETLTLINGIRTFVECEKSFLIMNLKIKDVANHLDISEYRISRAIRLYFCAENFNQYINELRISHAKTLLRSNKSEHWTILVIGLESGFSSIVSFNRVFKSLCGCTPTEFRQTSQVH